MHGEKARRPQDPEGGRKRNTRFTGQSVNPFLSGKTARIERNGAAEARRRPVSLDFSGPHGENGRATYGEKKCFLLRMKNRSAEIGPPSGLKKLKRQPIARERLKKDNAGTASATLFALRLGRPV